MTVSSEGSGARIEKQSEMVFALGKGEQPDSLLCPYRSRSQERTRCQASGGNDCGSVVTDGLSACLHLLP